MAKIQTEHSKNQQCDIQLPQEIIESFARFLVPEIRKYYNNSTWKDLQKQNNKDR